MNWTLAIHGGWTATAAPANAFPARRQRLALSPAWLVSELHVETFSMQFRGNPVQMPKYWDPVVQKRLKAMLGAVGKRYHSGQRLKLIYVPQMTSNGTEGHFNGVPAQTLLEAAGKRFIEFDPNTGFLPLKNGIEIANAEAVYTTDCRIVASAKLRNGSWFPTAAICFNYVGDSDIHIRTWIVDDLSEDVSDRDVGIEHNGQYQITEGASSENVVYTTVNRMLTTSDLYDIRNELDKGGVRHLTIGQATKSGSSSFRYVLFFGLNVAVVVVAFYLFYTRKHSKTAD